jgi:hypothetical protein
MLSPIELSVGGVVSALAKCVSGSGPVWASSAVSSASYESLQEVSRQEDLACRMMLCGCVAMGVHCLIARFAARHEEAR